MFQQQQPSRNQRLSTELSLCHSPQGRIQDFKLGGGGAHLKKSRRAGGAAIFLGVFRVKNQDFTQKNHIFPILGESVPGAPLLDPPLHLSFCFEETLYRAFHRCFPPNIGSFWQTKFREEDFQKSTNLKQELPVATMFVNGSKRNEQYLQRTFHRCFLPSFISYFQKSTNQK